jgi:HEAT repeat protein
LARSANPDAIADLAAALTAHPSGPCRDRLLIAAAGSGDVRCEALAIAALLHGDLADQQRDALLAALRDSREPATINALLALLSPAVPKELQLAVLRHLPTMPGLELDGTLRQLIAAPANDPQIRGSAILAMPDSSRAQSADFLRQLLSSDSDPFVRACAAAIMPADQAPALIAALGGDASPLVRCFAAARLAPAGGSDAIAALEQALGDADPAVRTTAAQALSEEVCCGAAAVQAQVGERLRKQAGIESDGQVLQAIQQAEHGSSPAAAASGTAGEIIGHQSMTNFAGPTWSTPLYAPIYSGKPSAPPSRPFGHG